VLPKLTLLCRQSTKCEMEIVQTRILIWFDTYFYVKCDAFWIQNLFIYLIQIDGFWQFLALVKPFSFVLISSWRTKVKTGKKK
jgi:hypothetical protein